MPLTANELWNSSCSVQMSEHLPYSRGRVSGRDLPVATWPERGGAACRLLAPTLA